MLRDGDILRYHGNSDEVGCFVAARPLSRRNRYYEALYPAVGMHSPVKEVLLDLNAEWGAEDDDEQMIVDSHEEDWGRLHDVRVTGTLLEYVGEGKTNDDVGLAQARRALNTRFHYYELEITDAGEKCYIAVGLAHRNYPKDKIPGWTWGSISYMADNGWLFQGSRFGDPFGPLCCRGDIMGCGIMFPRDYSMDSGDDADDWDIDVGAQNDLYANSEDEEGEDLEGRKVMVFFTRNRELVGRREVALPVGGFYPTIGMMSTREKVRVDLCPLSG